MLLVEGALTWPLEPSDPPEDADPDVWAIAVATAVDWLWRATAMMFGTRDVVYRPKALVRVGGCWPDPIAYLQTIYGPLLGDGWPYLGDPRDPTTTLAVIELPGPVVSSPDPGGGVVVHIYPDAVMVGDGTIDPDVYRVDGNWLVRVDGDGWPSTQNLIANLGDANTWDVEYTRGRPVPLGGQVAAQRLAAAWYPALAGDPEKCKLPYNVTTVSRAGVTINRDVLKALKTSGVQFADVWVASVNPGGSVAPGSVWSPDLRRGGPPYAGSGIPR